MERQDAALKKENNAAFAKNAGRIWIEETPQKNTFARFTGVFTAGAGKITVRIAAETDYVFWINGETAGYPYLRVKAAVAGQVKVAYGEHITDGGVRYWIHNRDFSLDFDVKPGKYAFIQHFVRVAGRYLEVFAPEGTEIVAIALIPALYPLTEKGTALTGLDRQIYDTCVRTLRLCMNLHYEDCLWREQALYVEDSRNQMLCGHYAFAETEFQRENLLFLTRGMRKDGFFELAFPVLDIPAIPFFSVMYPAAVYEYIQHTGDKSILTETMPAMRTLMENFRVRIEENGLIAEFEPPFWNFYEWSDGNSGSIRKDGTYGETVYHLILNCAYVYALERFLPLCEMAGGDLAALRAAIMTEFFDAETGLFHTSAQKRDHHSALGNALALCIGFGDTCTAEALKNGTLQPATLSMMGYVYDALLLADLENCDFVLSDIRKNYGYMLDAGATSFWETIRGEADFGGAGSLCQGWSAMPIYYFINFCEKRGELFSKKFPPYPLPKTLKKGAGEDITAERCPWGI